MTSVEIEQILALLDMRPIHERLKHLMGWRDTLRSLDHQEAEAVVNDAITEVLGIIERGRDSWVSNENLKAIKLWSFSEAPAAYQYCPDDADWVMFVPNGCNADTYRLEQAIGVCDTKMYPVNGGIVYIGCHA